MAPEQPVKELGPGDSANGTLYSLAVVRWFQLLTWPAARGRRPDAILATLARKSARRRQQFRAYVDACLMRIIRKAIAVRPEDRHADVGSS